MRVAHTDNESAQHFLTRKTLTIFSCERSDLWIWSPTLHQLSHPVTSPVLFVMYATPLSSLIKKPILHEMFADDTQLSNSDTLENYNQMTRSLHNCSVDVQTWMSSNTLKLNCDGGSACKCAGICL